MSHDFKDLLFSFGAIAFLVVLIWGIDMAINGDDQYNVKDCAYLHSRAVGAKAKGQTLCYDVFKPERNKGKYCLEFIK